MTAEFSAVFVFSGQLFFPVIEYKENAARSVFLSKQLSWQVWNLLLLWAISRRSAPFPTVLGILS
jgi:hypothetical protein